MKILLRDLESFIKNDLSRYLRRDLIKEKIVKEADLVSCAYFHIRKHLQADKRWRVFVNKYVKKTGHYLDLIIFKNYIPKVAFEFKLQRIKISPKDRKSLAKCIKKLKINRVYFITTAKHLTAYFKLHDSKSENEKYSLFEVVIYWDLREDKYKMIKNNLRKYKSGMNEGKSKKILV